MRQYLASKEYLVLVLELIVGYSHDRSLDRRDGEGELIEPRVRRTLPVLAQHGVGSQDGQGQFVEGG